MDGEAYTRKKPKEFLLKIPHAQNDARCVSTECMLALVVGPDSDVELERMDGGKKAAPTSIWIRSSYRLRYSGASANFRTAYAGGLQRQISAHEVRELCHPMRTNDEGGELDAQQRCIGQ